MRLVEFHTLPVGLVPSKLTLIDRDKIVYIQPGLKGSVIGIGGGENDYFLVQEDFETVRKALI